MDSRNKETLKLIIKEVLEESVVVEDSTDVSAISDEDLIKKALISYIKMADDTGEYEIMDDYFYGLGDDYVRDEDRFVNIKLDWFDDGASVIEDILEKEQNKNSDTWKILLEAFNRFYRDSFGDGDDVVGVGEMFFNTDEFNEDVIKTALYDYFGNGLIDDYFNDLENSMSDY